MREKHTAFECLRCKEINVFPRNKGDGMNCVHCEGPVRLVGTITAYEEQESKAPPLGIEPKSFWMAKRKAKLGEAIKRYLDAEMNIPAEWIEEWNKRD